MMVEKKPRKRLTRAQTVELKASKLKSIPPTRQEAGLDVFPAAESTQPFAEGVAVPESAPRADLVKAELRILRKQLAEKTAEYRALVGKNRREESKSVLRVLELLSGPNGATKNKLIAESGAKKGYIDALLNRILPARGYKISSIPVDGARSRAYRIDTGDDKIY